MKSWTKSFQVMKTLCAKSLYAIKWTIQNVGGIAGLIALIWQVITFLGDLEVELSNYWIYSRKVERVKGANGCAVFDTITLPLTFYNTGGFAQAVRMLRLEVWTNGKFCKLFQANREYEVFDQEEIEHWRAKGFYINSVVPGHSSMVKVVEFYPVFWWKENEFTLESGTQYTLKLFMGPGVEDPEAMGAEKEDWNSVRDKWRYMGSLIIETKDIEKLRVDPARCEDQVDSITY